MSIFYDGNHYTTSTVYYLKWDIKTKLPWFLIRNEILKNMHPQFMILKGILEIRPHSFLLAIKYWNYTFKFYSQKKVLVGWLVFTTFQPNVFFPGEDIFVLFFAI